jgi:hypothetical protein
MLPAPADVEVRDVLVFAVIAPAVVIVPLADKLTDVAEPLTAPVVMPAFVAVNENEEPELASNEIVEAATSVMVAEPVAIACSVVAVVEAMLVPTPPLLPAVIVNMGVLSPVATSVEVTRPFGAVRVIDVPAV